MHFTLFCKCFSGLLEHYIQKKTKIKKTLKNPQILENPKKN